MSDDVLRTIDESIARNAARFHPFGPPPGAPKSSSEERLEADLVAALRAIVAQDVPPPVEARPQPPTNLLGGLFGTVFSTPPPEPAPRPWWRRLLGGGR